MAPPLVTLLSSPPEFQYIALRNISIVLQKYPQVFNNEVCVFFCKYNNLLYVKLEKLEILIRLSHSRNIDQLLNELKEYANEVNVEFVRRSVNAIGRCAIKISDAAESCIHVLLNLIRTGVSYVVQEAIVVIKDVFRKYPQTYEGIIPQICENLDVLDELETKAVLSWIIGEYAENIANADDLIRFFLVNFKEENSQVQLQLLTATVKLFLKKPSENQALVQEILQVASMECDNADIRDRAYVYWGLLSTDPQAAKTVVLSEKPPIAGENQELTPALLDTLMSDIDNVYKAMHKQKHMDDYDDDEEADANTPPENIKQAIKNNEIDDLLDLDWSNEPDVNNASVISHTNNVLDDLLSLNSSSAISNNDDIMKLFGSPLPMNTATATAAAGPFANLL